ncbi:MAG: 2-oxo acid dehydrogenase subunit E2 [Bradymonadales bacterium]|nr:2-oxo acid dehydrogenase subunit E2 [Bradymonadales bacterium]
MSIQYVKVKPLYKTPPFRRVALGTWGHPTDPQIYGTLEVDLTKANEWKKKHEKDGVKISPLPMVARAIALAMQQHPDLNGFIRFKKIYIRQSIDLFFQVATEHKSGRHDLTGVRVTEADKKGVIQIAAEIAKKVERVRKKQDTDLQKTSRMLSWMPGWMVWVMLKAVAFLSYTLNLKFPGLPPDSFGGCMITNVGSLGLDMAYAPLVPYSRVPLIILLGQAKPRPVVEDSNIAIREVLTLNATIDHRFCDGALLARMVRVIQEVFDNPDRYFEPIETNED